MRNLCNTCIHEEVCGIEDHGEDAIKYCIDHYPKPINCKHCLYGVGDDPANMEDYYNAIKDAPTIEAEQVRHGRWIEPEEYTGHTEWHCSYCGDVVCTICGYPSANYCPNCGAKMRGEADE